MPPLIAKSSGLEVGDMETAAASAMLHSFYTEIEKILKLIAASGTDVCLQRTDGTRNC
jgi:hypothetical protein